MVSIYADPPQYTNYNVDLGSYVQYDGVIVRTIRAVRDIEDGPQSLYIGASCNLEIEVENDMRLYTSNDGKFQYYWTSFSNGVRSNQLGFGISKSNANSYELASDGRMVLRAKDPYNTVQVGTLYFQKNDVDDWQYINTTKPDGFRINDTMICGGRLTVLTNQDIGQNLTVGHDVDVGRNLYVRGNVFAPTLALWRDKAVAVSNAVDQIGFAFRINDNDQLELVRYSRFYGTSNHTVTQRVGVFGNGNATITSSSDTSFSSYDELNGLTFNSNTSNLGGAGGNASIVISNVWGTNAAGNLYYNGGKVGIANSGPEAELDVGGTIKAVNIIATNSMSSAAFYSTSDVRLKNVMGMMDNIECWDKLMQVNVKQYTMRDDGTSRVRTGFIAQELEAIVPEAVITANENGLADCRFIDPNTLLAYTVGAIQHGGYMQQEARNVVDNLQSQVNDLREQLYTLITNLRRLQIRV